jgi:hypothetical protein
MSEIIKVAQWRVGDELFENKNAALARQVELRILDSFKKLLIDNEISEVPPQFSAKYLMGWLHDIKSDVAKYRRYHKLLAIDNLNEALVDEE